MAVLVVPFAVPEIVTAPLGFAVADVATVNVAVDCPAETGTFAGTVAAEVFELASVTS